MSNSIIRDELVILDVYSVTVYSLLYYVTFSHQLPQTAMHQTLQAFSCTAVKYGPPTGSQFMQSDVTEMSLSSEGAVSAVGPSNSPNDGEKHLFKVILERIPPAV